MCLTGCLSQCMTAFVGMNSLNCCPVFGWTHTRFAAGTMNFAHRPAGISRLAVCCAGYREMTREWGIKCHGISEPAAIPPQGVLHLGAY